MSHPSCPACEKGQLLPLSGMNDTFAAWVCSSPKCNSTVSVSSTALTYYEGTAAEEEKTKGEKRWTEFNF